jgi:hypothetical protein
MKTNFEGIKNTKTVMVPKVVETIAPRVNVRFKISEIKNIESDLKKLTAIGVPLGEDTVKFLKLATARAALGR